jgi:hypothetical protein
MAARTAFGWFACRTCEPWTLVGSGDAPSALGVAALPSLVPYLGFDATNVIM